VFVVREADCLYAVRDASAPKATLNVTGCGKFSSDHFAQYAAEILASAPVCVEKEVHHHFATGRQAGS
jgi:hypothetical protein